MLSGWMEAGATEVILGTLVSSGFDTYIAIRISEHRLLVACSHGNQKNGGVIIYTIGHYSTTVSGIKV